jgi:DNA-directed RNA polymerase subunit B'
MVDIFLDEKFIGSVEDANKFLFDIRASRRKGDIPNALNLHYDEGSNEIIVETNKGRVRRPLIIVKNGVSKLTEDHIKKLNEGEFNWDDLVKEGIIEYIDAGEEEDCYVALDEDELTKEHTHLEVSPITILGLCTSLIPYSNFGSSSRLIRGSKIQKQSLGMYSTNFLNRLDTDSNVLHYPQKPIVKTFMHDILNYENTPSGQNFTIAVMSYEGYNMEDAVIINKGSIDRGLARSTYYKPYKLEELRYSGGLRDEVGIPDKETKGYKSEKDYRHLETDGIAYTEAKLKSDDVVIGRSSPPRFLSGLEEFSVAANIRRESSSYLGEGASGTVDMTYLTESNAGNRLIKTRLRQQRIPEIGDKFASRHGQKGVIGMLYPQEDMPFTESGITPDIIFSPHSLPGRMTISHVIEILAGKLGAIDGKYIDAASFDTPSEGDLRARLLELGFRENGTETMYNGLSGQRFKVKIFTGNIYYLRLKHMAANKLHTRAAGRVQLLTRQPVEGRAMGGGLRLGEMEKDCLVAHGASLLLKERFDSDKTIFHVCEDCGMIAVYDNYRHTAHCPRCGASAKVSPIELSYAFKLLLDEIKSLGISPSIKLEDKF